MLDSDGQELTRSGLRARTDLFRSPARQSLARASRLGIITGMTRCGVSTRAVQSHPLYLVSYL